MPPQWSPALTAGKSGVLADEVGYGAVAAMEPGPHGREELSRPCAGWTGCCGRNGARPSRPGRDRHRRRAGAPPRRRNGARPSRPGRADHQVTDASQPVYRPQWSPALTAGKRYSTFAFTGTPVSVPQWSPALTAGKSVAVHVHPGSRPGAAMEPGPHGREEPTRKQQERHPTQEPQWSPALTAGKRAWENS